MSWLAITEVPEPDPAKLNAIYRELEFFSLLSVDQVAEATRDASARFFVVDDPEAARALLQEAGVPQGLRLDMALPQPYEEHIQAGQVVQDYLRDVGIEAEIRIVEWGVWLSQVYGGPFDFDVTVVGHTGKLDPSGRLSGIGDPTRNYTGLDDPELVELIATANRTSDPEARADLYERALVRIHEQAPFLFFGTPDRIYARRANVDGFWMTPLLDSFDFRQATLR